MAGDYHLSAVLSRTKTPDPFTLPWGEIGVDTTTHFRLGEAAFHPITPLAVCVFFIAHRHNIDAATRLVNRVNDSIIANPKTPEVLLPAQLPATGETAEDEQDSRSEPISDRRRCQGAIPTPFRADRANVTECSAIRSRFSPCSNPLFHGFQRLARLILPGASHRAVVRIFLKLRVVLQVDDGRRLSAGLVHNNLHAFHLSVSRVVSPRWPVTSLSCRSRRPRRLRPPPARVAGRRPSRGSRTASCRRPP